MFIHQSGMLHIGDVQLRAELVKHIHTEIRQFLMLEVHYTLNHVKYTIDTEFPDVNK